MNNIRMAILRFLWPELVPNVERIVAAKVKYIEESNQQFRTMAIELQDHIRTSRDGDKSLRAHQDNMIERLDAIAHAIRESKV